MGTDEAAVTVTSALERVTVHDAGAVCVRRATVDTGGSERARVLVTGLPPTADARSLRAWAGPDGAARVVDVRPWADAAVTAEADVPALRRAAEEAGEAEDAARARLARLRAEADTVAGLRVALPQHRHRDGPRPAPVESMLALGEFVDARLAELHERITAAEEAEAAARHAAHLAEVALRRAAAAGDEDGGGRTTLRTGARLTLDRIAPDGGPFEVFVEYRVPGARWVPAYRLALDAGRARGVLTMRACVAQRTGEDWTGVRLGLSTASLARRSELPELRALRIGRRQEAPAPAGWREPPPGLAELFGGYDAAVTRRPAPRAAAGAGAGAGAGLGLAFMEEERAAAPRPVMPAMPVSVPPPMPAPMAAPAPPAAAGPPRTGTARARRGGPRPGGGAGTRAGGMPPGAAFAAAPDAAGDLIDWMGAEMERSFAPEPSGYGAAPPPPEPPAGPSDDLLDYAALVLSGPDAAAGTRGRLAPEAARPGAAAGRARADAEAVSALPLPAHAADPRAEAGSYDYRFDTAAPVDVEGDGAWHVVPVCRVEVDTEPEFVTVPAVEEKVYGVVRVTNASPHALLAGPADVTVGGDFLMTVPMPTLAPGESRRVGLGVAESVQVSRRLRMHESTAGLRGGTTVLDHRLEIEVANLTGAPVTVEVRERVPYSEDKDVRIDEHRAEPAWEADEGPRDGRRVRGGRTWRVPLAPGASRTLTGGYVVRIPSAKAVVGGNRRA